jgi:hypothetical protein
VETTRARGPRPPCRPRPRRPRRRRPSRDLQHPAPSSVVSSEGR